MMIRFTLGTMIAAGAVAAFSFLVPRETTAAFYFAEVQREVAATRTVAFTTTMAIDGQPRAVMRTLVSASDRLRVESKGHYTVIDFKARKGMNVDTMNKTVQITELTTKEVPERNLYTLLAEVAKEPVETLPERSLDGKQALGFVANWHGHEVSIWVDPKIKLPVRIETTRKDLGHTLENVIKEIAFDLPLDDSLFQMIPPPGYGNPLPFKLTFLEPKLSPVPEDRSLAAPSVTPRLGIGPARFGMKKEQVVAIFGLPDHEFLQGHTTYLFYRSRGFELAIQPNDRPRPGLSRVSCLDREDDPMQLCHKFQGKTDKGISLGASRAEVVAAYGPPDRELAARAASEKTARAPTSMDHETLEYQKLGLSFALFRDKVSRITLDAPQSN